MVEELIMDQEEKQQGFSSLLPILPRLDRLDRLLLFLEQRYSLSSTHSSCSTVRRMETENQYNSLSSALEEIHVKGTIMERLEMLENRVVQLSLEMNVDNNTSRSSSSTILEPEKTKENGHIIITHQVNQASPTTQESSYTEACGRKSESCGGRKGKRPKMRHKKSLGWFRMESC